METSPYILVFLFHDRIGVLLLIACSLESLLSSSVSSFTIQWRMVRRFFTSSYSLLFLGPLVALAALSETETTIPVPSHVSLLLRLPLSCAVVSSHP